MDNQNSSLHTKTSLNNSNFPPSLPPCSFVQWNVHGFWPRKPEIDVIISTKHPIGLCLQETHLKVTKNNKKSIAKISGYDGYHSNKSENPTQSGGVSIYIQTGWTFEEISLNTDLEVIAGIFHWHYPLILVSIYIHPNIFIPRSKIENLLHQLDGDTPFLILGDINASNPSWGSNKTDPRGHMIEEVLIENNIVFLNDGSFTNLSVAHGTFNVVDLSLVSPQISSRLSWEVADDLHGSDHYPIFITDVNILNNIFAGSKKWIESSADWQKFNNLIHINLANILVQSNDIEYNDFLSIIINAANESIPVSKPSSGQKRVPWWNDDIKRLRQERKKALRRFKKHPTTENKNIYMFYFSETAETVEKAKTHSWHLFTESIDLNTSPKEMWNKIKAIQGARSPPIRRVKSDLGSSTDPKGMADLLVRQFCFASSNQSLTSQEVDIKNGIMVAINNIPLDPIPDSPLNLEFSYRELKRALNKSSGKSCGPNQITYNMLKNLPINGLNHMLYLYH